MSQPYEGDSTSLSVPGLTGRNSAGGVGVFSFSTKGEAVHAESEGSNAVHGDSVKSDAVVGFAHAQGKAGVLGLSPAGNAVAGISDNGTGVFGHGVFGGVFEGSSNEGVHATSTSANAVHGDSAQSDAVVGFAHAPGKAGVLGLSPVGNAVAGISDAGTGVFGQGGSFAGFFVGKVQVNGDVQVTGDILLSGADCAEHFDIGGAQRLEPGTVVVIDQEGALRESREAYDKKVAGVISGAGDYRPGIVLDKQPTRTDRAPVALVGKVFCKVDAQYGAIEVGDLLTTSPTPGHAMKAVEREKAFGAVIGKALRRVEVGRGLAPILVAMQ